MMWVMTNDAIWSGQACDPREGVKPRIGCQDQIDSMPLHDGEMDCITSRELLINQDCLFRALDEGPVNGEHLVHDLDSCIKCWLDCVATVDGNISVQSSASVTRRYLNSTVNHDHGIMTMVV